MAKTADSLSEGIRDITECCICSDTFTNPRMLPCIHTFCHSCLEKTAQQFIWKSGGKVPCPMCRQEFEFPTNGVDGIQKNFFMEKLIEISKLNRTSNKTEFCEQCLENETVSESSVAEMYCVECQEKFCINCAKFHKRQKQFKCHNVVDIGSQNMEELKKSGPSFCRIHREKPVEMFCYDCNEAICLVCFAISHQLHKCSELKSAAEILKEDMKKFITSTSEFLDDNRKSGKDLTKTEDEFLENIISIENDIDKTATELIDHVQQSRDYLLSQLNLLKTKSIKSHEIKKEELNNRTAILENFSVYCNEMLSKGSNADVCNSIKDLMARHAELKKIHESLNVEKQLSSNSITFRKCDFAKRLKDYKNCIGTVAELSSESFMEPMAINRLKKETISSNKEFTAKLENEVEIASEDHKMVTSYLYEWTSAHNSDFQYVMYKGYNTILCIPRNNQLILPCAIHEELVVEQLESPYDMALCTISNSLYVTDAGNNSIWKIDLEEDQVIRWIDQVCQPHTLSVCADGRVVVPKDDRPSRLEVYSPDATLLQTIQLPVEICLPFRAVETPTGKFVILYNRINDSPPELCQIDEDGTITHTYTPQQKAHEISRECGIVSCLCEDIECIFIFSFSNLESSFVLDSNLAVMYCGGSSDCDEEDDNDSDADPENKTESNNGDDDDSDDKDSDNDSENEADNVVGDDRNDDDNNDNEAKNGSHSPAASLPCSSENSYDDDVDEVRSMPWFHNRNKSHLSRRKKKCSVM